MSSNPTDQSSVRSARLRSYFNQILQGKRSVKSLNDAKRFLEAICDQEDPSGCIERLIASAEGLHAVHKSLRVDVSPSFLNGSGTDFIKYLTNDAIKQLCSGRFLQDIITIIVEPPTVWHAFHKAHKDRTLNQPGLNAFAWLLLQLLQSTNHVPPDVREIACGVTADRSLLDSPSFNTRTIGQKIKHVLDTLSRDLHPENDYRPGGRHDNDFADFRQISILPTTDEFLSSERPFYRRADAVDEADIECRGAIHLDNQFRLLREDLLGELRNDLQIARGHKKGKRTGLIIRGLCLEGIDCGTDQRPKKSSLMLRCTAGIPQLSRLHPSERKSFISMNRNFMKHQSFGCIMDGDELVAFATVERNEELLAESDPVLVLQISGKAPFTKTLLALKESEVLQFVQVDTAVFAYEPVLKCLQEKRELPLEDELFYSRTSQERQDSTLDLTKITQRIEDAGTQDLSSYLRTPKPVELDSSQVKSLVAGLTQKLSLIQGPPGTGKSFIGALIAKILHDHTAEKILIICYTNHALDQFLEDILDIGIPEEAMVRLGAKSTPRTEHLSITKQRSTFTRSATSWDVINNLKFQSEDLKEDIARSVSGYQHLSIGKNQILEYLEFSEDESDFYYALSTPTEQDGMTRVGRKGRAVGPSYLLDRWESGRDAGIFQNRVMKEHERIWEMDSSLRKACVKRWTSELLKEHVDEIHNLVQKFDGRQAYLNYLFGEKSADIIKTKRIIGCTTTAAAKYARELQSASPGVIIVEEAGEILESHILTAMTPQTKQLVLIGDHKQLRAKVNNYKLTVEKGDGYNLNVSLFERLVLAGVPHTTLYKQHRMCPEISTLVKNLTYPDLLDAPKTLNRAVLRGFQDRVIFFDHDHLEVDISEIADRRDEGSKSSKQNRFEVEMVLRCIRYLGQQGYRTDELVVLTPYLAQLRLLRDVLSKENDPILNDLDSYDLVRAGLLPAASANIQKRPIRISTIDNYQGEESDIVISTLTRSNKSGEIGFMSAPQRVNVLLSRARNALIMIGNANTFMGSRKGKEVWLPLLDLLKRNGHIYDGFPVKCERHPNKKALLQKPEDFEIECPDGGCAEHCETKLNCGIHDCPQRCHQLYDHSQILCQKVIESSCQKNHKMTWRCHKGRPIACHTCDRETRILEEKRQRDHELDIEREAKQRAYKKQLDEIQIEIAYQRRLQREQSDQMERDRVLELYKKDLANIVAGVNRTNIQPPENQSASRQPEKPLPKPILGETHDQPANPVPVPHRNNEASQLIPLVSPAKGEWEHQKDFEGARNDALDSLMGMIGLENVKEQFLDIKVKIDTMIRQGTDLKGERFGAAFLGNPGTGKTTVARLYAKFLASIGALPGSHFVETSGSRISNDGVAGCKKHIEDILNNGGGALFIDEAYQLVSGHSYGGPQVLDFLLAEIENLTGKMVIILAGYNKQMEAFFSHNPGIPSRIPYQLQFQDYGDAELLQILRSRINEKYKGSMKLDGGEDGLYVRVVARRIGRGRGRDGFGNARAVHNAFACIADRQAKRLQRQRRAGETPDDMLLTKEDLLGPEPSDALKDSKAWSKLQKLIGLKSVKESVKALLDSIQVNYNRELEEKPLVEYSLNRVFLGSPGTGKTSVAKLYGQILADIGLLTSGEVVTKNPADFVGNVIGQSESNTKAILAATIGKVLIIDEAYMLSGSTGGATSNADSYKTAVIDTIVAEVQSTPGEDRCVLLLGYKDEMEKMFQNVNPGLSRRFPIDSGFLFEDFTDDQLQSVLALKLDQQGFECTDQAKVVARDMLSRARNRPHFGNAGEVDILLDKAKLRHQKRVSSGKSKSADTLEAPDFDEDFDRGERASTNIHKLFEGVIGCDSIITQLEGYQNTAARSKKIGMDPRELIPFNFLFRGPPGTGKTTTARRMGKVYYDMGFLATAEVVECSATDLVGQYVGQTGPKTQNILEKALGKVLFIDEAYRLAEGHFATEAMDEIVDCLTKPKFAQKLVTILAGYDADINRLMSINPGLTSRFPETIIFKHLSPEDCLSLFIKLLKQKKHLDTAILKQPSADLRKRLIMYFEELVRLPSWGNARDIESLVKHIFRTILSSAKGPVEDLRLDGDVIFKSFQSMISERAHRGNNISGGRPFLTTDSPQNIRKSESTKPPETHTTVLSSLETSRNDPHPQQRPESERVPEEVPRDSGISDAVWQELQLDKCAAKDRERKSELDYKQVLEQQKELAELSMKDAQAEKKVQLAIENAVNDEAKRRHEEERLRLLTERRAYEKELEELERRRKAAEEKKRKEAQVQTKLRQMGVCPVGYRWIKQHSGYRCAGGSHFVSKTQLGID
ncbi:MAG: hypothetical protein M1824_005494 [Vezdaea acicularis]|nr:MAG: hypothetical protein M1824_005494 [Vezdaea acicularis]